MPSTTAKLHDPFGARDTFLTGRGRAGTYRLSRLEDRGLCRVDQYEFLRWGQEALDHFRVVPPSLRIVHQVNLEFLAKCVFLREDALGPVSLPDTLVGTDVGIENVLIARRSP
jgi:hypothetical protein